MPRASIPGNRFLLISVTNAVNPVNFRYQLLTISVTIHSQSSAFAINPPLLATIPQRKSTTKKAV